MKFVRTAVCVTALAAAIGTATATAATPGTYKGLTKDGLKVTVKVGSSGKAGSFKFCGVTLKFKISDEKFSVKNDEIGGSGRFKGDKVTGKVKPSGCSSTGDSYSAER